MNLGANQKNMVALAVLLPVAAYMVYSTFLSGDSAPPGRPAVKMPQKLKTIDLAAQESAAAGASGAAGARNAVPLIARAGNAPRRGNTSQEWTPRVGGRRPEDRADPAKTDPTLKLDLLARLQNAFARPNRESITTWFWHQAMRYCRSELTWHSTGPQCCLASRMRIADCRFF